MMRGRSQKSEVRRKCSGARTESTSRNSRASSHHSRKAFTLIEMVVVIGIIVLLAALTVGVSTVLTRKAEQRRAEDTLKALELALQEWETIADRQITYGQDGQPTAGMKYEIVEDIAPGDNNDHLITRQAIFIINKAAAAQQILSKLDQETLAQNNDTSITDANLQIRLVDPWDKEYIVLFPGRVYNPAFDTGAIVDEDGTLRTEFEKRYGICLNRKIAFVSAGPDGDFGDLELDTDPSPTPANNAADDNMYSSPVKTRLP